MAIEIGGTVFRYKYDAPYMQNGEILTGAWVNGVRVFPDRGAQGRYFHVRCQCADTFMHRHSGENENYGYNFFNEIWGLSYDCGGLYTFGVNLDVVLECKDIMFCQEDVTNRFLPLPTYDPNHIKGHYAITNSSVWPTAPAVGAYGRETGDGGASGVGYDGLLLLSKDSKEPPSVTIREADIHTTIAFANGAVLKYDYGTSGSFSGVIGINHHDTMTVDPPTDVSDHLGDFMRGDFSKLRVLTGGPYDTPTLGERRGVVGFRLRGTAQTHMTLVQHYDEQCIQWRYYDNIPPDEVYEKTVEQDYDVCAVPITEIVYAGMDPARASLTGTPTWEVDS